MISSKVGYKMGSPQGVAIGGNILRQMNIKMGGELYQLQMPKQCSKNTMIIGLDVCHKGSKSIVGFCCSIT